MIYAELAGGLGNQMFIYAFARALGLRCGEGVTLLDRQDWRDGAPAHTVCALEALNLAPEVKILAQPGFAKARLPRQNAAKALMIKYEQRKGLMARDWHSWESRCAPVLNLLGLHFATDGYTPVRRGPARDFLAWGYFQSEQYFADFAPVIRQELRAKQAPVGPWADKIRTAAYPVALHLRRGDYCKPENEILQVCTPAYYARAAAAAAAAHPEATVFVFFRRHPLGPGKPGHRRSARGIHAPGGRSGGYEPDGPVPGFYPEQFHLQLVGPVSGRPGPHRLGAGPLVRPHQTHGAVPARLAAHPHPVTTGKGRHHAAVFHHHTGV